RRGVCREPGTALPVHFVAGYFRIDEGRTDRAAERGTGDIQGRTLSRRVGAETRGSGTDYVGPGAGAVRFSDGGPVQASSYGNHGRDTDGCGHPAGVSDSRSAQASV